MNCKQIMCKKIEPRALFFGVTSIGSEAFRNCSKNLKQIIVDGNNKYYKDIDNKILIDISNKSVILGS